MNLTREILLLSLIFVTSTTRVQTPPSENIVINQSSDALLSCPVTDCANVHWTFVKADGSVAIIGQAGNVFRQYQKNYAINTTAGYCTLIVLHATVDTTAGHINCQDLRTGLISKTFVIYVISDAPRCSATGTDPDGYARDGMTLSYLCLMTYGVHGTSGYVEMTWLNAQGMQSTDASRSTPQIQVSSSFTVVAVKPSVSQYTCRSSFGNKNISSPTIITKDCVVNPIYVKYPVTYVKLSREGENFVPGTNITCTADGVPPPTYRWIDFGTAATYVSGPNLQVNRASTDLYHCEASNTLNAAPVKSVSIMFNSSVIPDETTYGVAVPSPTYAVEVPSPNLVIVSLVVIISVIVIVNITICVVVKLRRVRKRRAKNAAIGESSLDTRTSSKPEKELTTSAQPGNVSVLYEEIGNSGETNYEQLLDNRTRMCTIVQYDYPRSHVNENVAERKYTALMDQSKLYQN